jgi:PAS domain S-box-containing protein
MQPQILAVGGIAAVVAALITALLVRRRPAAGAQPSERRGQRREELFRVAFEQSGMAMALVGLDGEWLQFNDRLLKTVGYRRDELVRTSFRELTHPDDRKFADTQRRRLEKGEIDSWSTDVRLMQRNGGFVWMHVTVALCKKGDDLSYLQYVLAPADRGGHGKAAPAAAAAASGRFEDAIEKLDDIGLFRIDASGTFTAWTSGAEKLFGYRAGEVTGKPLSLLYRDPDIHDRRPEHHLSEAIRTGKLDHELSLVRKDGFVVSTHTTLLRAGDGGVIGVLRLPTHLRRSGSGGATNQAVLFETNAADEELQRQAEERIAELEKKVVDLERARAGQTVESVRRVQELERELKKQKGIETSLREVVSEITSRSDETFRELKIMTEGLKKEIARRKESDALVAELREELAAARPGWHEAMETGVVERPEAVTSEPAHETLSWSNTTGEAIAERLTSLAAEKFTGSLLARRDEVEVRTYIDEGRVVAVVSSQPAERLGEALVRRGLVTAEQRDRALEIQQQADIALGRVLLIMDALTEENLMQLMRERTLDDARQVFSWPALEEALQPGSFATHKLVSLRLSVPELLAAVRPEEELVARDESRAEEAVSAVVADEEESPVAEAKPEEAVASGDSEDATMEPSFFGTQSKKSKKYHRPTCSALARVAAAKRIPFADESAATAAGYERCGSCFRRG